MNNHHDADMTDVTIVLDNLDDEQTLAVVKDLEAAGLSVGKVNNDESIVEGSIITCKVHDLKHIACVRYVRTGMSYTADYPVGDPRNLDQADDPCDESED